MYSSVFRRPSISHNVCATRPKLWRLENAKCRLVDMNGQAACEAAACRECHSRNVNFGLALLADVLGLLLSLIFGRGIVVCFLSANSIS